MRKRERERERERKKEGKKDPSFIFIQPRFHGQDGGGGQNAKQSVK